MMSSALDGIARLIVERPDGDYCLQATGRSMVPTIVRGDVLHLKVLKRPVQVGDIVFARKGDRRYLIHRVVSLSPELRTRGDANPEEDGEIESVIATVVCVQRSWVSVLRRLKINLGASFHARFFKKS